MAVSRGYHFYQNPGPTNIPDRVLRAMDRGAIDFTAAQFKAIAEECFAGLKRVFSVRLLYEAVKIVVKLSLFGAVLYFAVPAQSLPGFIPGYEAGNAQHIHWACEFEIAPSHEVP